MKKIFLFFTLDESPISSLTLPVVFVPEYDDNLRNDTSVFGSFTFRKRSAANKNAPLIITIKKCK